MFSKDIWFLGPLSKGENARFSSLADAHAAKDQKCQIVHQNIPNSFKKCLTI